MAKSTSAPSGSEALPYKVTSTKDQLAVTEDGRLQEVKVIYFTTPFGDSGHVSLPKSDFTAEAAQELIMGEVEHLLKLRGML